MIFFNILAIVSVAEQAVLSSCEDSTLTQYLETDRPVATIMKKSDNSGDSFCMTSDEHL